jgi:hypothetical protein
VTPRAHVRREINVTSLHDDYNPSTRLRLRIVDEKFTGRMMIAILTSSRVFDLIVPQRLSQQHLVAIFEAGFRPGPGFCFKNSAGKYKHWNLSVPRMSFHESDSL